MALSKRSEEDILMSLFSAYLEDLGRIGERHENTRTFYISVISALFVFLAMAGKDGLFVSVKGPVQLCVGVVGILVCVAWFMHMWSFAKIYEAKKKTLRSLEEKLPFPLFATEKAALGGKVIRLTFVDRITPVAWAILFGFLLLAKQTA